MPVVPNYLLSHQWVRELKRQGFRVAVGVYFRIPDDELVWAGLYNKEKQLVAASQAAAQLANEESLGFEVIIPRSVSASEIRSIRSLPKIWGGGTFQELMSEASSADASIANGVKSNSAGWGTL